VCFCTFLCVVLPLLSDLLRNYACPRAGQFSIVYVWPIARLIVLSRNKPRRKQATKIDKSPYILSDYFVPVLLLLTLQISPNNPHLQVFCVGPGFWERPAYAVVHHIVFRLRPRHNTRPDNIVQLRCEQATGQHQTVGDSCLRDVPLRKRLRHVLPGHEPVLLQLIGRARVCCWRIRRQLRRPLPARLQVQRRRAHSLH